MICTLLNTMTFHGDLPYTTKQFTTNLTDVTLTTWLLWSNKFRAYLLKDPIFYIFYIYILHIYKYNIFLYMYTYVKYIKICNIFEKISHRWLIIFYLLVIGTLLKLHWTRMHQKSDPSNTELVTVQSDIFFVKLLFIFMRKRIDWMYFPYCYKTQY